MDTVIDIINTAIYIWILYMKVYYIWKFCFFLKKFIKKIYLILQDKGD